MTPPTAGSQNRVPDVVNQFYFRSYDDPQKRLGAALEHIGSTDPSLLRLVRAWTHTRVLRLLISRSLSRGDSDGFAFAPPNKAEGSTNT